MALTDKLTDIADAIRDKTGGTSKLTLEEMVTAIEGIQAGGGGLPSGISALATGTWSIQTAQTTQLTIPHGMGVTPNFFILYVESETPVLADYQYFIVSQFGFAQPLIVGSTTQPAYRIYRYGMSNNWSQAATLTTAIADNNLLAVYNSSTYQIKPKVTYRWIAGVIDGL